MEGQTSKGSLQIHRNWKAGCVSGGAAACAGSIPSVGGPGAKTPRATETPFPRDKERRAAKDDSRGMGCRNQVGSMQVSFSPSVMTLNSGPYTKLYPQDLLKRR